MTHRQWFRNKMKQEMKGHKDVRKMLRKSPYPVTLHNQVMAAMGMYNELTLSKRGRKI